MKLSAKQSTTKQAEVEEAVTHLLEQLNVLKWQLGLLDLSTPKRNKLHRTREEELFFWWQKARTELYENILAGQFVPANVHQNKLHTLGSQELVYYNFRGLNTTKPPKTVCSKTKDTASSSHRWTVFFTPKAIAPCMINSSLQREVIESITACSLGYLQNSSSFEQVDEGPCTGMVFYIQRLSNGFYMVLCTELNKFIMLIEGVPSHYEYNQILKVLGIVKSKVEARRLVPMYQADLEEDSARFVLCNNLFKEGTSCIRRGVYMLPIPAFKQFLSAQEREDLEFNAETNRWVKSSAERQRNSKFFRESQHTRLTKQVNSMVLHNLLNHEDCRSLIEFLTKRDILKCKLTSQEVELIGKPDHLIAIGRSGTGKTTCALLRLLALQCLFRRNQKKQNAGFLTNVHGGVGDDAARVSLQCVFLSMSPVLVKEARSFYERTLAKLRVPTRGADDSVFIDKQQWTEDNEGVLDYVNTHKFPYFLSIDKFLMLIDSQLETPFFVHQLNNSPAGSVSYHDQQKCMYIFNSAQKPVKAFEVTFEYFTRHFWPKYQSRTRLSSATVWTELTSVLRGAAAVFRKVGRKHSTLSSKEKSWVKQVYSEYTTWKQHVSGYDQQDLIRHIIDSISVSGYHGFSIHYMIVDEVQDCPLNLLLLLIRLTEFNIAVSGDTAQAIAKGIGFKFGDLRSIFWQCSERHVVPELSQLTVNFRSHSRILDLANSLVGLLKTFFPESIDELSDESSERGGPKPIVIDSSDFTSIGLLLLDKANCVNRERVHFGCNQVILVRNQQDKQTLPSELKHAVCLTVLESKGLEFEDVVVYNFFDRSECSAKEWGYLARKSSVKTDNFDPAKHLLLCSELKHLYVAVTRAKQRLIFFDETTSQRECIQRIWVNEQLVEVNSHLLTESEECDKLPSQKGVANSSEEWRTQGFKLLNLKCYEQALKCFQFAQDQTMIRQATAYYQADHASAILSEIDATKEQAKFSKTKLSKLKKCELTRNQASALAKFNQAAELFESLGLFECAGQCFVSADKYDRAISAFVTGCLWKQAAEVCFRRSKYSLACNFYKQSRTYDMAIECLMRLNRVDEALALYKEVKTELKPLNGPEILATVLYRKVLNLLSHYEVESEDSESQWTLISSEEFTMLSNHSESFSLLEASSDFTILSQSESHLIGENNSDPMCTAVTQLVGEFREDLEAVLTERKAIDAFGRLDELIQNYDAVFDDRTDPEVVGLTLDLAQLFNLRSLWRRIKTRYEVFL